MFTSNSIILAGKAAMSNTIILATSIGLLAGIISAIMSRATTKKDEKVENKTSMLSAFLSGFLLFFLIAYISLYFMRRKTAKPDLETVMRHVKGGEPGF